ncbi:MAG: 5-formyltetrahydrofolate cyclo-ligase [Candidatus Hydrogenedentes bacterium]|nr:5-formyltetrahydrofolate cyclo-ligase [Candidatus Hydrogenedentota bacterium]
MERIEKENIRSAFKARRNAMAQQEVIECSAMTHQRLINCAAFRDCPVVASYIGVMNKEVLTLPLIARLLQEQKQVLVPRTEPGQKLSWAAVADLDELVPGAFGIPEPPRYAPTATLQESTVILVPGLAFDRRGYRIGFGGGYFDRFLADFSGLAIGLAYPWQLVERLPSEAHDMPVRMIVTSAETLTLTP